jgi:hypothetical protein
MEKHIIEPPADKPFYTRAEMLEQAHISSLSLSDRHLTDLIEDGLINGPCKNGLPGGGSEAVWPQEQLDLLLMVLKKQQELDQRAGHHVYARKLLCNIPVCTWLYWGEAYIPLDQVKRAMVTWARAYRQSPKSKAKQSARHLTRLSASPRSDRNDKEVLIKRIITLATSGESLKDNEVEDLLYLLKDVIDPEDIGEAKGPARAKLSAEAVVGLIHARLTAINHLSAQSGEISIIPDTIWHWARTTHLFVSQLYKQTQPEYASDPTLDSVMKGLFEPLNMSEMLNNACGHLLAVLGLGILDEPLPGLPPFLQPQVWKTGEITSRIHTYVIVSPLFLPDGSRYAYPSIEVEIINNSLQATF